MSPVSYSMMVGVKVSYGMMLILYKKLFPKAKPAVKPYFILPVH